MEMQELIDQMTLVYKIMSRDEFAEAIATMLWNIYSKAKDKGFSEQDALAITLSFSKSQTGK